MNIGKALVDFLYPMNAVCSGCGDITGADIDGLCDDCAQAMQRLRVYSYAGRCPMCLAPLRAGSCGNCDVMSGCIGRATYIYAYRGPAAYMVRRFKYNHEGVMARQMAEQMLDAPGAEDLLCSCDMMVCAPSDLFRRSHRGYNQAYLLARELEKMTGIRAYDLLTRRPLVRHQARLNREKRLKNLEGVISCRQDVTGKRILLIDDVRTTGATAVACARALKAAGAAEVMLLTFAASD